METAATKFGIKTFASPVHREVDIEQVISGLGRDPGNGLIAMTDVFMSVHRKATIELAMRHKMPLMYYISIVPREGGLISYGIDITEEFRRSAAYVDRILRGAKPAELPVQLPTKFELVVNLKAAKELGLDVSLQLHQRADEVIE